MVRNVPAEQEHLLLFMHERFLSMQEAASFFGGEDGIEAVLSADEFSFALRQSGYGRPSEQLFHSFSGGQNRIKVRDLLQFIVRIAEPEAPEAPEAPGPPVVKERSEKVRIEEESSNSRVQLPGRALDSQSSLNSQVKSVEDFRGEKQPSTKRQASFASLQSFDRLESTQEAPRDGELQEALSEALRLLAEERRERLSDRAEAQRRHKDLETWAEDRLRLVEHLASESRESTAEIRSSIQEALHLGEASERRTLGAVAEESRNRDLTLQREQQIREMITSEMETRFRKLLSDERASRYQESGMLQEQLGRMEENMSTERELQGKRMAEVVGKLDKVWKELEAEKDTRQVQMKDLAGRQDSLRSSFLDGTREIREIEDDQTRHVGEIEVTVESLSERMEQEMKQLRQGILELRQQLHAEIASREDSCSVIRSSLDNETKTRMQAVDKNSQLHEDLEIRLERVFRAMLHDERVGREDAYSLLDERVSSILQELNFEKAKIASQGRDFAQSIVQLKDAIMAESGARRDELDVALKSFQQLANTVQQDSERNKEEKLLQAISTLEASLQEEASTRDLGFRRCQDELMEARLLMSKETGLREEMEGKLLRRADEDRSAIEDSLMKLQSAVTAAEASGLTAQKMRQMLEEERQGRQQAIQQLEALLQKNDSFLSEERSLREEQYQVLGGRVSQVHGEVEDVRQRAREALGRCEELRSLQESLSQQKAERQAEASSVQLSLNELSLRIEQLQQALETSGRTVQQKWLELQQLVEEEAQLRQASDDDLGRKQATNLEAIPKAMSAERHCREDALGKLEDTLRQEQADERQRLGALLEASELRWQQLREATEDAIKHRVEQHGTLALELAKVADALGEETRERQKDHKVLQSDVKRLAEEAQSMQTLRRQAEEGLREQIYMTLQRLEQAQETMLKQDSEIKASVGELSSWLSTESATRKAACEQLQKELQQDAAAKEELVSVANKGMQRVTAKVEDLRSALREESVEREELRSRVEQQAVQTREALDELRNCSERREADLVERVNQVVEAQRQELQSSKAKHLQLQEALEELRKALLAASLERRNGEEGLVARLAHLEAALGDQVAAREEEQQRMAREVMMTVAKLQEETVQREEAVSKVTQQLTEQAAVLEDALHKESKARDEALSQAVLPLHRGLKAAETAREDIEKNLAMKIQQLSEEQQQEREERSRLLRDVAASLSKLQRMQAEEEELRSQENERLGSAVESMQEVSRNLRHSYEELRQRSQESSDQLRSMLSREATARQAKLEAVDSAVRELRSQVASETQQREVSVKHLSGEIYAEVKAREEATSRDRRAMEEDVAKAVREHRRSREEEERKVQQRLLETSAKLAEEREQRLEQLRAERLRLEELREELLRRCKAFEQQSEKTGTALQRLEDWKSSAAKEQDLQLARLNKSCEELRQDLVAETQRIENACRVVESKSLEVESSFRSEGAKRQALGATLREALEAAEAQRAEQMQMERQQREQLQMKQEELHKMLLERQKERLAEQCVEQLAQLKEQLAEDAARRDHWEAQKQLQLAQLTAAQAEQQQHGLSEAQQLRQHCEAKLREAQVAADELKQELLRLEQLRQGDQSLFDSQQRQARSAQLSLEAAIGGLHEELQREALQREEALKRLEGKLREAMQQAAVPAKQEMAQVQEQLQALEDSARQRLAEESRRSKASVEKLSQQISALVEDVEKSRAAPPERAQELARSLAQLDRRQAAEEQGRHQASISLQRALDALREDLLGEVKERRQQGAATSQEVQSLLRNWQLREDKAEAAQQQLLSELGDLRERVTREVRSRESALLQLEGRLPQQRLESYAKTSPAPATSAISTERWRQAEEDLEKTKSTLASLKSEASNLSKAISGLDEQYESVRVAVGVVQSDLSQVQQKQSKTSEVENLVSQARQELQKECQERKAEGSQLSSQLLEHAERLEWAEQQRMKAESALLQDLREAKTELKREIRDREEGQSQVSLQLREEISKREEALEREARLRVEGEERQAQQMQAAVREERRQRVQSELRLGGDEKVTSGTLMNVSALEEQSRLQQQLLDLQARVASSEARQKTTEERTVNMLDAIMNGLMSGEA